MIYGNTCFKGVDRNIRWHAWDCNQGVVYTSLILPNESNITVGASTLFEQQAWDNRLTGLSSTVNMLLLQPLHGTLCNGATSLMHLQPSC